MIDLLKELDIYAVQLNEWFLSGVKPDINLISIKVKLISLKLNTNLKDKDLKNVNDLLDRVKKLILIGL
jgi:hypothetical protein